MRLVKMAVPLALFAICSFAQDIRYNFDKTTDFSKFRTFKWVPIKGAQPLSDLVDRQIKGVIEAELMKKGLHKATGEEADLWIGYQFSLSQEKEFSSYSSDFGYGPGWGRGWYGGGMGSTMTSGQTTTIHIGEVAVDMYDPATKQIVWRGAASRTLDPKAKPDKRQKNAEKAMAKLLKNYPPPVKKG